MVTIERVFIDDERVNGHVGSTVIHFFQFIRGQWDILSFIRTPAGFGALARRLCVQGLVGKENSRAGSAKVTRFFPGNVKINQPRGPVVIHDLDENDRKDTSCWRFANIDKLQGGRKWLPSGNSDAGLFLANFDPRSLILSHGIDLHVKENALGDCDEHKQARESCDQTVSVRGLAKNIAHFLQSLNRSAGWNFVWGGLCGIAASFVFNFGFCHFAFTRRMCSAPPLPLSHSVG